MYILFFYGRALQEEIEASDDGHSQQLSATKNVVRVRVLLGKFKPMMAASIQELRRAGLKIDCFGLNENADRTTSLAVPSMLNKPLSCPITVLCNDICAALKKLHFSVYQGDVYKRVAESQFTFKFLCPMKTFLLNLMGNETFKDRLVQHFQRVLPLLSEPESNLISQLTIDRNLVEVQDGWLWSFSAGSFVQGVIPESEVSRTCTRINDQLFLLLSFDNLVQIACAKRVILEHSVYLMRQIKILNYKKIITFCKRKLRQIKLYYKFSSFYASFLYIH